MNLSETADLLTAMSAFDRRTIGDGDVIAWQSILSDAAFEDCLAAVKQYYTDHTEWIMPAHVRRAVAAIEKARQVSPWAPGQHGVPRNEAVPEVARGERLALSDLTASVADLVAQVRAALPEGSREALAPRRVAWEREHRAFDRQQNGEPNPHYRPRQEEPGPVVLPDERGCADCGLVAEVARMDKHLAASGHHLHEGVEIVSSTLGNLGDRIPTDPGPDREAWLTAHGWTSYEEWAHRGE